MQESLIIVDIGTSSIKTSIFDLEGNIIPEFSVSIPHQIISKNDGTSQQDPNLLCSLVEQSIDNVLEKSANHIGKIIGVGFDCMASTLVGIDKSGDPITPIYTYADTRSDNQVIKINKILMKKDYIMKRELLNILLMSLRK